MAVAHTFNVARMTTLFLYPALKTEIVGLKLWERPKASKGFAPTKLRTNLPSLDAGGVDVVFSAIYGPVQKLIPIFSRGNGVVPHG